MPPECLLIVILKIFFYVASDKYLCINDLQGDKIITGSLAYLTSVDELCGKLLHYAL